MSVPYTFATQSGNIPLSELDANFSNVSAYSDTAGTVTQATQANITSVGTLSSLTVAGAVIGASFSGNGASISALKGANVTGTVANATYALTANAATYSTQATYAATANAVAGANVSGTVANATYATSAGTSSTVTANAQSNITSVGTLTSLSVTGNITAANLGNIASLNLNGNANTVLYGNGTFAPAAAGSSYGDSNVTTLLSSFGSNTISTTGNLTAGYFVGNGSTLTNLTGANVSGTVANATYALTSNSSTYSTQAAYAGTANAIAGANVSGTVANATYALTANAATYSVQSTYAGTANSVAGANVSGTVANATYATSAGVASSANAVAGGNVSGQVGNALIAGTVYTAAQPNITSVGNLTSLAVTGNITSSANVSGSYILGNGSQLTGLPATYGNANVQTFINDTYGGNITVGTPNPDYLQLVVANSQVNIASNSDIKLDTIASSSGIVYNPVTGVVSLDANKTYQLTSSLNFDNFSPVQCYVVFSWVNAVGNTEIVTNAQALARAGTTTTQRGPSATLNLIYSPSSAIDIKLRAITVDNGSGTPGTAELEQYSTVSIIQINPSVALGNISTTGNLTAGNIVATSSLMVGNNTVMLSNVARYTWVSNAAPDSGDGNVGDIWYQTV